MKQSTLPKGFRTHSIDVDGKVIRIGDRVTYDFDDNTSEFEVVFEDNAFRKKYPEWDNTLVRPIIEFGSDAEKMRLKVIKPYSERPDREKIVKENLVILEQIHSGDITYRDQNVKTLVSRLKAEGIYSQTTYEGDIIRSLMSVYKNIYGSITTK